MELLLLLMFVPKVGLMFPDVGCREDAGDELVVVEKQLLAANRLVSISSFSAFWFLSSWSFIEFNFCYNVLIFL